MTATPPLEGLTVLDFSHALAGPYATMLLAAYGATVIKVEGVDAGDIGRGWGPPFLGNDSAYFVGLNSGKQAVAIDLKDPRGVALCRQLAARADILLENFRPGTLTRLGLGYDDVKALNPRLIYCSISGYGQTGPRRDEPAMDLILQAASGLISVTGTEAGELVRCGHSVADVTAGMFSVIGILMALRVREATGRGQLVDVSMLDGMISAMASTFANLFGTGVPPKPHGTAFGTIVPYACFPTQDREIAIAVASDKLWSGFCDAIGQPALGVDQRFASNADRVANRSVLEPLIVELFRKEPAAVWLERLRRAGVPCTPVNNLAEVAADPHAVLRGMFPTLDHPTAGAVTVTGPPVQFSESGGEIRSPAPRHGEHSGEVLGTLLGLDESAIADLTREGVVRLGR
ncbi:MAG: CaiB/BaiF CoA transferase family protein [Gemmatimonadales bacterium]